MDERAKLYCGRGRGYVQVGVDGFRGVGKAGEDSFGVVGWEDGGRGLGVNIARESSSSAASAAPRTQWT
mgnify:CR=1 FL=1